MGPAWSWAPPLAANEHEANLLNATSCNTPPPLALPPVNAVQYKVWYVCQGEATPISTHRGRRPSYQPHATHRGRRPSYQMTGQPSHQITHRLLQLHCPAGPSLTAVSLWEHTDLGLILPILSLPAAPLNTREPTRRRQSRSEQSTAQCCDGMAELIPYQHPKPVQIQMPSRCRTHASPMPPPCLTHATTMLPPCRTHATPFFFRGNRDARGNIWTFRVLGCKILIRHIAPLNDALHQRQLPLLNDALHSRQLQH